MDREEYHAIQGTYPRERFRHADIRYGKCQICRAQFVEKVPNPRFCPKHVTAVGDLSGESRRKRIAELKLKYPERDG